MSVYGQGRCPACGAGFRGAATCSRCGADLSAPMSIAAAAYRERQAARRFLLEGDAAGAASRASEAQRLAPTSAGEALLRVASVLAPILRESALPVAADGKASR